MNHLHRFYAEHAAEVWQLEGRWMADRGTFRAPVAVQWLATRACDLACAHCYSDAGHRAVGELSTEEALGLVDAVADLGAQTFVIAGGEPLLRHDLRQVIEHAVRRGLKWSMHTHGGQVFRHRELFEQVPASLVTVSLDGSRPVHDALRGPGSYDKAIAAIRYLVEETRSTQVVAGTTVTRLNADTISDLMDDVIASKAHTWGLHLFAPEGRGGEHRELLPTPGQLSRVAALTRRMRRRMDVDLDNEWGSAGHLDPFYRDQPFLCGAGRFTFVVAPTGEILPCTTTDLSEAEGNVRTHDLKQVWQRGFTRFRTNKDAKCSDGADCWLQTRNGNSCRAHAFGIDPVPVRIPEVPQPRRATSGGLQSLATLALATLALAASPALAAPGTSDFPASLDVNRWAQHSVNLYGLADGLAVDISPWRAVRDITVSSTSTPFPKVRAALTAEGALPSRTLMEALDEAESQHVWDPGDDRSGKAR